MKKILVLATALLITNIACADLTIPANKIKSSGSSKISIGSAIVAGKSKPTIKSGSVGKMEKRKTRINADRKNSLIQNNVLRKKSNSEKNTAQNATQSTLARYETLKAQYELQLAELVKQGQGESAKAQQLKAEITRLTTLIASIDPTKAPRPNSSESNSSDTSDTTDSTESTVQN